MFACVGVWGCVCGDVCVGMCACGDVCMWVCVHVRMCACGHMSTCKVIRDNLIS